MATLTLPPTTEVQITRVVKALYDAAPGNLYLNAFKEYAAENGGVVGVADGLLYEHRNMSNADLAQLIVDNLGLAKVDEATGATGANSAAENAKAFLLWQFNVAAQTGASRGQVLVDALNNLATLGSDPIFGKAADFFNASIAQAYSYSIDPAHSAYDLATLQAADEVQVDENGNPVPQGQTFMLTEDQDDVAGTSGNDTIKGTDSTLTVFDNIDGGAGTDTIRLTFTKTVAAIAAGVEVANVENVIINAAGANTTADISGWTGVENVTVNAPAGSVDLTSAATGAVTVDADADAIVEDEAAATVTVTAGGAAVVIAGDADITVDAGAAGEDAVSVSVTAADAGAVVVTVDGEDAEVAVTADSADSVSIDGAADVAITVDDLGAVTLASAVVLDEDDAPESYTQVVADITTVDNTALDLTLNGADVELNASDSDAGDSEDDDDLTTLNLTLAASALDNSLNLTSTTITDINITGAGNLGLTVETDTITDIDASEATGDISVTIAGSTTNYAGGAGVDTVTLSDLPEEALDEDDEGTGVFATVIDGGEGDADVIEIDATAAAAAADIEDGAKLTTAITGFEKLSLTGFDDDAVDATLFGIDYVVVAGTDEPSGGSVTIASEGTVELTTDLADIALVVDGADADGADAADFSLNVVLTGGEEGIAAGVVTVDDVGAIALASNGTADEDGVVAAENSVELAAAAATTLTVTGNAALDLTGECVDFTALETVAAGDFDAGLTIDVSSSAAEDGVTITTGDGDDTITGGAGDDVISAGNGTNMITGGGGKDTMTGGTGVDTYVYTAVADSQGTKVDVITNFQVGTGGDVIDLSAITSAGTYLGEANGYGAVLTSLSASDSAEAVLDTSTNTLYIDIDGSGTLDNADMVIQLTGVTSGLVAENFVFGSAA